MEELMLTLNFQYFNHQMKKTDFTGKHHDARRWRRKKTTEKIRWLDSTMDSEGMSMSRLGEWVMKKPEDRSPRNYKITLKESTEQPQS